MARKQAEKTGVQGPPDGDIGRVDQILDHSVDLIRQHGLAYLTMKKVAERVGFTETAAYRYFPNKRALLLGIAGRVSDTLLEPMREIAQLDIPARERLERMLRHHVDFVIRTGGFPMLLLAEAAATGEEDVLARLREIIFTYLDLVADVIGEMNGASGESSFNERALLVLGIPASLAILARVGVDSEIGERVRANLIPYVASCLAAD